MIVKDYMQTDSPVITKDKTLAESVKQMVDQKTNGMIVVESLENKKPIGMISSRRIIMAVVPDYLEDDPNISSFESEGQLDSFITKFKDMKVEEFMCKVDFLLSPNDTMIKAATFSTKATVRTIPVVDENGILLGSITRTAIKNAIHDSLYSSKDTGENTN